MPDYVPRTQLIGKIFFEPGVTSGCCEHVHALFRCFGACSRSAKACDRATRTSKRSSRTLNEIYTLRPSFLPLFPSVLFTGTALGTERKRGDAVAYTWFPTLPSLFGRCYPLPLAIIHARARRSREESSREDCRMLPRTFHRAINPSSRIMIASGPVC